MTVTDTGRSELTPARPVSDQDWRRLVRMGAVGAVAQMFIALSNMPVRLDERVIVKPVLSLGYLTLLIVPFAAGHRVGHQIKREGMPVYAAGAREVAGGAACGAIAGGGFRCWRCCWPTSTYASRWSTGARCSPSCSPSATRPGSR